MEKLLCFNAKDFVPGFSKELLREIYPVYYFGSFVLTLVVIAAIWLSAGYPRSRLITCSAFIIACAALYVAQPVICSALPLPYPFNNIEIILALFAIPQLLCLGLGLWLFANNPRAQTVLMLIAIFTTWQFGMISFG